MKKFRAIAGWTMLGASALALAGCGSSGSSTPSGGSVSAPPPAPTPSPSPTPTPAAAAYTLRPLDSSMTGLAPTVDANLQHGWGIAFLPGAAVWVADHANNKSTLYDGDGTVDPLVVDIPANAGGGAAAPTGIVGNTTNGFVVTEGTKSAPAAFIFDGTGGTISGWSQNVDNSNAITMFDGSAEGDVFTGLAIYTQGSTNMLLAANFAKGTVDAFDTSYKKITLPGGFSDPNLPTDYKPFGVQTIGNQIFVSYAHLTPGQKFEDHAAGLGLIDVFDATGTLVKRLVDVGGALNAPWGMALAPSNFGAFSNDLLIGNFGDGTINVYDPQTGKFVATMSDANGTPLVMPGLWGMAFGNDALDQPSNTLFYAAGPAATTGVYGRIDVAAAAAAPAPTPTPTPTPTPAPGPGY